MGDGQRVDLQSVAVVVGVAVDAVDVVGRVHRMGLPRTRRELHCPAFEEHHGNVDTAPAGRLDAVPEPAEVVVVVAGQVELRTAVCGEAGTRSGERLRGDRVQRVLPVALRVPGERLPRPQPHEVVVVLVEEVEIGVVVEHRWRVFRPHVDQAWPGMRTGQVDHPPRAVGEVARVVRMHAQRPGGGSGRLRLGGRSVRRRQQPGGDQRRDDVKGSEGSRQLHRRYLCLLGPQFRTVSTCAPVGPVFHHRLGVCPPRECWTNCAAATVHQERGLPTRFPVPVSPGAGLRGGIPQFMAFLQ